MINYKGKPEQQSYSNTTKITLSNGFRKIFNRRDRFPISFNEPRVLLEVRIHSMAKSISTK